jgi:hypothetical protein
MTLAAKALVSPSNGQHTACTTATQGHCQTWAITDLIEPPAAVLLQGDSQQVPSA